jgi:mannose-1-phosphate guanylyltransferase
MPGLQPGPSHAYALILAGGGGTRLWPASRRKRPKQLLTLGGDETLLAATYRRAQALFSIERTLIVTAADQADAIRAALPGLPPDNLIAEPAARNTAAAVGLGAIVVARRAGDSAVLAVLPSDAHIGDEARFADILRLCITEAQHTIVTIGVQPTHPETGFGYLRLGPEVAPGVHEVARFVEKPDLAHARTYLASGDHFWNSGMFFFSAGRLLEETRRHMPDLGLALDRMRAAADFDATVRALYPGVPAVSIDYGVMEKATGIRVVPGAFGWNDVGSWNALAAMRPADAHGNVVSGDAVLSDTSGSVVHSEPGAPLIGVVGVKDLVIIATKDAILVVPRDRAQDVRTVVEALKNSRRDDLL